MTSAVLNDEDNQFLDLIVEHPNLLKPSHEFYHDEFMRKASWGQIALALAITTEQAQEKWKDLCDNHNEESALRGCESIHNLQALDKSRYDDLYHRLHVIHESVGKTSATNCNPRKRGKARSNKQKLYSKCAKKSEDSIRKIMDHVIETSVVAEQESTLNKNIGDLIVAELVSRSPNTIEKKRKQILRLLAD